MDTRRHRQTEIQEQLDKSGAGYYATGRLTTGSAREETKIKCLV